MLLNQAGIRYQMIPQNFDESYVLRNQPIKEILKKIALKKMDSITLPAAVENDFAFVLTADTMGSCAGKIFGKPSSKEEAVDMIQSYKSGAETYTAFCLDKKKFHNGSWNIEKRVEVCAGAQYIFDIPDYDIERYFELSQQKGIDYLNVSGAVAIEEFGAQFLKTLTGSYSAVVGLPMYELRESLYHLGFVF